MSDAHTQIANGSYFLPDPEHVKYRELEKEGAELLKPIMEELDNFRAMVKEPRNTYGLSELRIAVALAVRG